MFEACIAVLWKKIGNEVLLTPAQNDKGADVVVFGERKNILIQVKQSINNIGDSALGEVLKSKGFYKDMYSEEFQLAVVTNSHFTDNARDLAKKNKIKLFGRSDLIKLINEFQVTFDEVLQADYNRSEKI